jgi:hypothetical protein
MASLRTPLCVGILSALVCGAVLAQEQGSDASPEEIRNAQVERLRAEMTNTIYLQANDLVDELVFGWKGAPPFSTMTLVVLADVVAPVGFGSGLEALIENHLASVLTSNNDTNVGLAHCPSCHAILVHSGKEGTIISKGIDQPLALKKLRGSSGAEHALFLDFEAEGTALVLRARITKLDENLPIVYARTLTTRTSSAALLRSGSKLLSAEETRAEYVSILEQRGPLTVPVRLAISAFAQSEDAALDVPIPVPWLQVGAEYAISSARAWTGSLVVGVTFLPTLQTGGMVQVRASRLLTGSSMSLTRPNLYGFVGGSLALLQGTTATLIPGPTPAEENTFGPVATYIGLQTGLEFRLSNRIGGAVFIETMPTMWDESDNIGNHLEQLDWGFEYGPIQVNSIGAEVTFAF